MKTLRILAVAAALAAAWPASASAATKLWFGTHNVKRGDGEFTPFAGVLGFQEVEDPADKIKMRQSLPGYDRFVPKGDAGDVPIAWDRARFALKGKRSILTHKGESLVTPARFVNWVRLRDRRTGAKFYFVNTHFISKAWTSHPERRARWKRHARILRKEVGRLRATGLPVFLAGDFNRRGKALGIPGMTYVGASPVPLDHLYVSDGIAHGAVEQLPKDGSDHFAWRLRVEF
jgi:Endonuclease/Exonuclease/phosphatase family